MTTQAAPTVGIVTPTATGMTQVGFCARPEVALGCTVLPDGLYGYQVEILFV